jgi:protocatechuate 3,4-dioxygenase beta subunit
MIRFATLLVVLGLTSMLDAQRSASFVAVRGRVVSSADSAVPLRGARVFVVGSPAATEPVFTDNEGRFAVGAPPSYTLKVTKAGFAPAIVAGTSASPDLQIRLSGGAVLTGVIVDELGFPVHDARVRARWVNPIAGAAAAGLVEFTADTDDIGQYRIGSLPAGSYAMNTERPMPRAAEMDHVIDPVAELRRQELTRVLAQRLAPLSDVVTVAARISEEVSVTLVHKARSVAPPDAPIGGAATGIVLDEFGDPVEGVTLRLRRLRYSTDRQEAERSTLTRRTDDRGHYRFFYVPPGRYLLEAAIDETGYAPVYYPGVTAVGGAAPIVIGRKQETPGLNVVFTRSREARVFGFALGAGGGPLKGNLSLTASHRSGTIAVPPRSVQADASGVFEFLNVPPGEYVLRATRAAGTALEEFGMQFVTVSGPEVAPITIAASPAGTISGRLVLDGSVPGVSPSDFALAAVPDPDYGPIAGSTPWTPRGDGTFEMRGLAGLTRLTVGRAPTGWWLKSVDIGGINAAETPVRFAARDDSRADVTVVFSAAAGTITGRVLDERGEPADDYRVLVFSIDRARWFGKSQYVRITGGPDIDGGFTMRSLPPGDYWITAVDAIDGDGAAGDWQNPDVLNSLVNSARRISVGEGQRASTELRLIRLQR